MEKDINKAWKVDKGDDGYYFRGWDGTPYGPYKDADVALDALEDYHLDYESIDEEIIDPDKNEN